MKSGIIFVAGVYGVGKSTLCGKLESSLKIPSFSAGDIISDINGEIYGMNKTVKDKTANQIILIEATKKKLLQVSSFVLAGHFCILNSANEVEVLPEFVYKEMPLSQIILLESDPNKILLNIQKRDNKSYSEKSIVELIDKEHKQAVKVSSDLNLPLIIHQMKFDETDADALTSAIQGSDM